jgi:hypothetical protein
MFNETTYNRGLSGEAAKQKRREKFGIPEGVKAGKDYVDNVWLPSKINRPTSQPDAETSGSNGGGSLGFDLPKKIAGIPSWMMLTGGALLLLTMFKGGSRGKRH